MKELERSSYFTVSQRDPIATRAGHESLSVSQSELNRRLMKEGSESKDQVRWPNFLFLCLIISRFLSLHPGTRPRCESSEAASPML